MHSLGGNRGQWAVITVSVAAIAGAFAVTLVRRQKSRQVPAQVCALVQSHKSQQPTDYESPQLQQREEHVESEELDGPSTTVVEDMYDVVPSRGHIRHELKHSVLLPAAATVFCVLCDALLVFLVVKGYVRESLVVLAITILLRQRATKSIATSASSLSTTSKLELLQGLDQKALNELLREDLPRWVKFPDVEKCEWLNQFIARMWPYAKVVLARSMKEALIMELELAKPTIGMTELGIRCLNFGTAAPTINGIKFLGSMDEDQATLDVDLLVVTQNSEIVLSLGNPLLPAVVNVEIANVVVRGTVRVVLKPLFPWWPTFGALSVSFIEKPTVEFQLKTLHVDIMELPALARILHKVVYSVVDRCCLWPNKVLIPFVEDTEMLNKETLTANHARGVLVIREVRVNGARPSRAFSRWSGAYSFRLHFSVGKENVSTDTIRGQHEFDFTGKVYQLLVLDPYIQDLTIALEFSEVLQPRKQVDSTWVHLSHLKPRVVCGEHVSFGCNGERGGEFKVSWFPFSRGSAPAPGHEPVLPSDIARMGALSIKLSHCERLASMDMNGASDPYVVFRVGCQSKKSSVKRHTLNPIWDPPEHFELLVSDWQHDELSVVVMDSDLLKSDDTIGHVQIALSPLRNWGQMSDNWLLEGNRGSVTLELQLQSC